MITQENISTFSLEEELFGGVCVSPFSRRQIQHTVFLSPVGEE